MAVEGFLENDEAKKVVLELFQHLADWPIKTAEAFRNAVLGDGYLVINPMLNIQHEDSAKFLQELIRRTVAEGRMIDFGFIPNDLIQTESFRSRDAFEAGELQHPFDSWLAVSAWEGGMCGYHISPNVRYPDEILVLELYGVSIPGGVDAVIIYDVVSIQIARSEGKINTLLHPLDMIMDNKMGEATIEIAMQKRGANSLDPLVTMLRLLADASVPVEPKPAPERLNRQRAKHGKFPIPAHTVVDTKDYVASYRSDIASPTRMGKGGHHASPMAHWRRAHQRTLASGRVVAVRSSKVNWRDTEELHRLFYRTKEAES
jgi:hypothetical protein